LRVGDPPDEIVDGLIDNSATKPTLRYRGAAGYILRRWIGPSPGRTDRQGRSP